MSDEQVSGDISVLYRVSDEFNVYGRYARGFRAPTIQGRDVAFFAPPSVADSETIDSIEAGFKSDLADNRVRLNGSVYYYEVKDQQLTAIGGAGNLVQLVNADKGIGMGFDLDGEFLVTDRLLLTAGFSYNDTEIEDSQLVVGPCGSGLCTVLDPRRRKRPRHHRRQSVPAGAGIHRDRHGAVRRAGRRRGRVLRLHRLGVPGRDEFLPLRGQRSSRARTPSRAGCGSATR